MDSFLFAIALVSFCAWLLLLLLPWFPWLNRETIEADPVSTETPVDDVTILIPARDEASVILPTLTALISQEKALKIIVVDDNSSDGTGDLIKSEFPQVQVLACPPKPQGWSGKLWALHHGLQEVRSPLVLLLDADIQLQSNFLSTLYAFKQEKRLAMVSVLALLRNQSVWEKLLIPAFVFFFKQIYPFRLSNSSFRYVAAAAGGCMLLDTKILRDTGGFEHIKAEIIDDCSLARQIKGAGHPIWTGLSHEVVSNRSYNSLESVWSMVDRSAFCQLSYSVLLLFVCTLVMLVCFWGPVLSLLSQDTRLLGSMALIFMFISYIPTLRFYIQSPIWVVTFPLTASLYLLMTWSSALKYWFGAGAEWKGRRYSA